MLRASHRLSRQTIERLQKRGRRMHSAHASLVFCTSPNPGFAVVVSKKVAPTAVARNRLRRRVYETIRTHLTTSPSIEGMFILRKGVLTLSAQALREEIVGLLKSAQR